jgi:hypothetical protein
VDSKLSARHEIPFGIATSPSCHRNTTDWYRHSQKSQFVVHSKGGQGNGQVSRNRSTTVPAHKLKGRRPSRQQDDKRNFMGTIRHDKVNDIEILANAECEPLTSKGEALATAIEELPPKYRHTPSLVSDVDAIQEAVHVIRCAFILLALMIAKYPRTLRCELKELKAQVELARQPSA